jgi:hypothetical protein
MTAEHLLDKEMVAESMNRRRAQRESTRNRSHKNRNGLDTNRVDN